MLTELLRIVRRDVLFVSTSPIDEVWTRTTAIRCHAAGLSVEVAICGGGGRDNALVEPYRSVGIPVRVGVSLAAAAGMRCAMVVTASSGLNRRILPTRAKLLVHMPHSLASLHMIYPADAFDGYDVLLAAGPQHEAEFDAIAAARGLVGRSARAAGYGKLDVLAHCAVQRAPYSRQPPCVLLAPSWGPDNLLDRCGVPLATALAEREFDVVLRPHPLFYVERAPVLDAVAALSNRHPRVRLESPFDGDDAIFDADVLVGDYSGAGFEFAALRRRPIVSVDVGLKIVNPDWCALGLDPVEVACRSLLGPVVAPDVATIVDAVQSCAGAPASVSDDVVARFLHGRPGECGERAAGLIEQLLSTG